MAGGRPRTVSYEPEEMIKLGQEMVAWIKENDPLHVSEWYCIEKGFLELQWETMIKRPEFVTYYEQALKLIGKKYLDRNSNVRDGISQRWQRVYFKDLKREEDETARFNASLKEKEDPTVEAMRQASDSIKKLSDSIKLKAETDEV